MSLIHQCYVCGEKFDEIVNFCPSCGADQRSSNSENASKSSKENKTAVSSKGDKSFKGKSKSILKNDVKEKSISVVKLIYMAIFLFLAGALLMYSSGVFDSPGVVKSEVKAADPHSGVDLTSLQQINELEEKVKSNPKDFNTILELAHLLNDSGFKEKAIERYKEYLNENPNSADVLVDMGVCYFELGKNQNAILNMEKAIKIEPKHQIAHLNLGIVNSSMGNKQKAIEYWQKAIQLNSTTEIAKRAQELINQH